MKNFTLEKLRAEMERSRRLHGGNAKMIPALAEEVGEMCNALLEHERGNKTAQDVFDEAIQVAATALRIAEEGDRDFLYRPEEVIPDKP